jgi:bacillithiol biosynthesis cysteine-adding enzyme BshC
VVNQLNEKIPLTLTGSFSKLFLDYLDRNPSLSDFSNNFPDLEGFKNQIENRKFENREILVDSLKVQYTDIQNPPDIDIFLDFTTFSVTTGHQLNLFTGPLYVIFKIVSTINLAKKLKVHFPSYNFVPVYWMATEDHDFEEISNFNLFGQKHTWATSQKGAVGRMNPAEIMDQLENVKEKPDYFLKAYNSQKTLANAVRQYMHELFGSEGLICVDADDHNLKSLFKEIIKDDIFKNSSEKIVNETSQNLEKLGYKTQIHAREINMFFLDSELRERIEKKGEAYQVINTSISFSQKEMAELIEREPEKLSPNVVLRPIYQECILPNLAYLGGPSELTYWLQLKDLFEYNKVPFPILMPRNFGIVLNSATQKRIEKLGISVKDLFLDEVQLRKQFVEKNTENNLSLASEVAAFDKIYENIIQKAVNIDPTLKAVVEAEKAKHNHQLENLEKRMKKAEERTFEAAIGQLSNLKEKLFPGGVLQERKENFLNFYLNDPTFLDKLFETFDPFEFEMNVVKL